MKNARGFSAQGDAVLWLAGGAVTALLCYAAVYHYLLYSFYELGSVMLDAGWFSALISNNDWRLRAPVSVANAGESYYYTHISPFLVLFTYLPLPIAPAKKIAFFLAVAVALYGAVLFAAIADFLRAAGAAGKSRLLFVATGLAAAAAAVIALNGVTVNVVTFAHFEIWITVFVCLFLGATAVGRKKLALLAFVLLLTVREDAGFHLTAPLGVLLLVLHWRMIKNGRSLAAAFSAYKILWVYAVVGFVVSLVLMNTGLGLDLHGSGVEWAVYRQRLWGMLTNENWLVAVMVLLAWSVYRRQPLLLLGLLFVTPWALYNAYLQLPIPGNLSAYYAFPFLSVFYWHFIAERFFATVSAAAVAGKSKGKKKKIADKKNNLPGNAVYYAMAFVLLFALATTVLRNDTHHRTAELTLKKGRLPDFLDGALLNVMSDEAITDIHRLKTFYDKYKDQQTIYVTQDFGALFPHSVPYRRIVRAEFEKRLFYDNMNLLIINRSSVIKSVPVITAAYTVFGLSYVYRLADTSYVLFSDTPMCDEQKRCADGLPLLKISEDSLIKQITDIAAEKYVADGFHFDGGALAVAGVPTRETGETITDLLDQQIELTERVAIADAAGVVVRLPGIPVQGPGTIGIRTTYTHSADMTAPPLLRIYNFDGSHTDITIPLAAPDTVSKHTHPVQLPAGKTALTAEIIHPGSGTLIIKSIEIAPGQ